MNELIKSNPQRSVTKRHLLAHVSAIAFPALLATQAFADDRPPVWIELGAQLERLTNGQDGYSPPFVTGLLENPFTSPTRVQASPRYSNGEETRISFQPEGSEWGFSAALRYGRANSSGNLHQETSPASGQFAEIIPDLDISQTGFFPAAAKRFANTTARTHSTSLMLDFQAGREVGLGAFGAHGSSTLDGGLRFAQFTSGSTAKIDSDPNFAFSYKYITAFAGHPAQIKFPVQSWDLYSGKLEVSRSFSGIGPSLSWDADATLISSPDSSTVTFDWGLNGALLFGRQKMQAHHETMAHHRSTHHASGALPTLYPTQFHDVARSRSVFVPNFGGFAGLSLRFPNAKVSLGYRIDAFFGAVDGGIDSRKTYDRDFYGPFATISIGLGG